MFSLETLVTVFSQAMNEVPKGDIGVVIGAIGRHPTDRKKYAVVDDESGRYACTHWELKERLGDYSLIRFKLDTGRTHQIRVHSAYLGHPILGDPTYSRCKKTPTKLTGQTLHAIKLSLKHPVSNEDMHFEAPLPISFLKVLSILRK